MTNPQGVRPEPRDRTDHSPWTSALGWLLVILALIFPFPWW